MTKFLMTIAAIAVTTLALTTDMQAKGHGGGRRGGHSGHRMGHGHGHRRFNHRRFGHRRYNRWGRYGWYGNRRYYWWRYNRYSYYRPYTTGYSCTTCNEVEPPVANTCDSCPATTTCNDCQTTVQDCPATCDEGGISYGPGYRYRYGYRGKHYGRRPPIKIRPLDRGGRLRSRMNGSKGSGRMGGGRRR